MPNLLGELRHTLKTIPCFDTNIVNSNRRLQSVLRTENIKNEELLFQFLYASDDESRLRYSSLLSSYILHQNFFSDAEYLRTALLKKEITQNIEYEKHRDHTCHTLYNYLLGWYFFIKCQPIQKSFAFQFLKRKLFSNNITRRHITNYFNGSYLRVQIRNQIKKELFDIFSDIWPYTSLLHDIGYIMEGSITSYDSLISSNSIKMGAEVINNFYSSIFWKLCGLSSSDVKQKIIQLVFNGDSNFRKCFVDTTSTFSIADSIRGINFFNLLGRTSNHYSSIKTHFSITNNSSQIDAFDLWNTYNNKFSRNNIYANILKEYYEDMLTIGSQKGPIIFLDHGIVSGLFLLQYSILYTVIKEKLTPTPTSCSNNAMNYFRAFNGYNTVALQKYNYEFSTKTVYEKLLWSSYATASHSFLLTRELWPKDYCSNERENRYQLPNKITLEEDPLVYLGCLVDVLQEWDRYSVSGDSAINGSVPFQGKDMKLRTVNNKVIIAYPISSHFDVSKQRKQTKDIKDKLNEVFHGYNDASVTTNSPIRLDTILEVV